MLIELLIQRDGPATYCNTLQHTATHVWVTKYERGGNEWRVRNIHININVVEINDLWEILTELRAINKESAHGGDASTSQVKILQNPVILYFYIANSVLCGLLRISASKQMVLTLCPPGWISQDSGNFEIDCMKWMECWLLRIFQKRMKYWLLRIFKNERNADSWNFSGMNGILTFENFFIRIFLNFFCFQKWKQSIRYSCNADFWEFLGIARRLLPLCIPRGSPREQLWYVCKCLYMHVYVIM